MNDASQHAKSLSALGAAKGGLARAEKLTPEQRTESARKAADARWGGKVTAHATHAGDFRIGDRTIVCAVLDDGRRVLTQETFLTAIGRAGKAKAGKGSTQLIDNLPPFLAADYLKPFIPNELRESTAPVIYRTLTGQRAFGFEAKLLPMVCNVYLKARDAGVLSSERQKKIAAVCDMLMRGLAEVGIIALIDEATGYQYDRARTALEEILERFISKELVKWVKTFPDEFYIQLFRLKTCPKNTLTSKRPQWVGKVTLNLVYQRLAPGVREELQRLTPRDAKGRLRHKLFQRLTEDMGHPKLREHFIKLLTLMQVSDDWDTFYRMLDKALPKYKDMPLFRKQIEEEDNGTMLLE